MKARYLVVACTNGGFMISSMRVKLSLVISLLVLLLLGAAMSSGENVRKEAAKMQEQTGLTLAWYYSGLTTAQFAKRAASREPGLAPLGRRENALPSPDGSELAFPTTGPLSSDGAPLTILRRDGTVVAKYPEAGDAEALCWSHDRSKLVVNAQKPGTRPVQFHLQIVNLSSASIQDLTDKDGFAFSQCWSPDDSQIVYAANEEVRVYDLKTRESRTVARGSFATWSPDGQRIAFKRDAAYFTVSAAGADEKMLFKAKQGLSELWWSPDSRMVAYISEGGTFRETLKYIDVGLIQIRVRRLADGAEDWVYQTPDVQPSRSIQCVWVSSHSRASAE